MPKPNQSEDRLPKPIDEMTDDELWDLFPEDKSHCAKVVGESALGPLLELPHEVLQELQSAVEGRTTDS